MKNLFYLMFLLFLISCNDDFQEQDKTNIDVGLSNERLQFKSIHEFRKFYDKYKDYDEEELYNLMKKYYDKGFLSLITPAFEGNIEVVNDHLLKKIEKIKTKNIYSRNADEDDDYYDFYDEIEDLISSEVFAAFLNDMGEIHVGDSIYKYTDVGIFSTKADKYIAVDQFLEQLEISKNLLIPTDEFIKQQFLDNNQVNGKVNLNEDISYFRILSIEATDPNPSNSDTEWYASNIYGSGGSTGSGSSGGSGGSTGGSSGSGNQDPLSGFTSFSNGLTECNQVSSIYFGSIFGPTKKCENKYSNRRRVRTKVWSHNYFLIYHLGTKVKHQKRNDLRIWYKTDADVMVMAVDKMQFEYDYTHVFSGVINQNIVKITPKQYNVQHKVSTNIYSSPLGTMSWTTIDVVNYPMSNYINFIQDDLVIEVFGNGNSVDNVLGNIVPDVNIAAENLNNYFWTSIWNTSKSYLQSNFNSNMPNKVTLISTHPSFGKIFLQKSHFSHQTNCKKLQRTFDWGASLKFKWDLEGNISFNNFSPGLHPLAPKKMRAKLVGAVKVNGVWHGTKVVL